jgi:hypothetical protein
MAATISKKLEDYINQVESNLQENMDDLDRDNDVVPQIAAAVKEYSTKRPRQTTKNYDGDGDAYEWDLPDDYELGFSTIDPETGVEYPARQRKPEYLDARYWTVYKGQTLVGETVREINKFRFLEHTPSSGEYVSLTYTVRHTLTGGSSTIPDCDFNAVCDLATSFCLAVLANRALTNRESTIEADSVDWMMLEERFRNQADWWKKEYERKMGLAEGEKGAGFAFTVREYDTESSYGRDRLTHPARNR